MLKISSSCRQGHESNSKPSFQFQIHLTVLTRSHFIENIETMYLLGVKSFRFPHYLFIYLFRGSFVICSKGKTLMTYLLTATSLFSNVGMLESYWEMRWVSNYYYFFEQLLLNLLWVILWIKSNAIFFGDIS